MSDASNLDDLFGNVEDAFFEVANKRPSDLKPIDMLRLHGCIKNVREYITCMEIDEYNDKYPIMEKVHGVPDPDVWGNK